MVGVIHVLCHNLLPAYCAFSMHNQPYNSIDIYLEVCLSYAVHRPISKVADVFAAFVGN